MSRLAAVERGAAETEALWRDAGLEPEPYGGMFRGLYLDICPPSFQTELPPPGTRVEHLRPEFDPDLRARVPDWFEELPDRPLVYVTLGTVHNDLRVFRVLLDGLDGLDCNVIATIGRDNDPAELEPIPPNARVERYIPQSLLFRTPRSPSRTGAPARPSRRSPTACRCSSSREAPTSSTTQDGAHRSASALSSCPTS